MNALSLTKLEVARRQLETAAKLWFEEGDAVSIHTLVAASHTIVHDVAAHRDSGAFLLCKAGKQSAPSGDQWVMLYRLPEKETGSRMLMLKARAGPVR